MHVCQHMDNPYHILKLHFQNVWSIILWQFVKIFLCALPMIAILKTWLFNILHAVFNW